MTETTEDVETTEEEMTEAIKTETAKEGASKETTVEEEITIDGVVERHTTTMIGNVQSAKTQTLLLEPSVTVVENLDQAVADVGHAEIAVEDPLDATTVPEHLDAMMVEDHLAVMTVPKHLAVMMVEDRLAEMAETDGVRAAMKIEAHTAKNDLNASQGSLEHLENHVAMAQAMHIIDLQNQSADVKMTTREGQQWVPNITTSML